MGGVGYWLCTGHVPLCNTKHVLDIALKEQLCDNLCIKLFTELIRVLMFFFIITGSDRIKVKDQQIQTEITKPKDQQVQTGSLAKQQGLYVKLKLSFH